MTIVNFRAGVFWIIVLASVLLLGACTTPATLGDTAEELASADGAISLTARAGDAIVDVPNELRPLRLCFISALAAEVLTDRVRLTEPSAAPEALGALAAFDSVVAGAAEGSDPVWVAADMKNAAYVFAEVVARVGEGRIAAYIKSGLSIDTVLNGARRLAITSGTAAAMIADTRNAMAAIQAGELAEETAWTACRRRIDANRAILTSLAAGA